MALENTVAKYTVQIVQDGTVQPAVQEFNNLRAAAQNAAAGTSTATAGLSALRAEAMLTRESTRLLSESAYLLGGTHFPQLAMAGMMVSTSLRTVREAAIVTKLSLSEILLPIAALAAAIGGGILIWKEWNSAEEEAAQKAKDLVEAWKELPPLLEQINKMQQVGLMSPAAGNEYSDYLTGKKKLYKDSSGQVTPNPTEQLENTVSTFGMSPYAGSTESFTSQNKPASQTEIQKWVQDQTTANGLITKEQVDAIAKLKELEQQANDESILETHAKYEKLRQEIQQTAKLAGANLGGLNGSQLKVVKDAPAAEAKVTSDEAAAALAAQAKDSARVAADAARQQAEDNRAQAEALQYEKNQWDELQRSKKADLDEVVREEKELGTLENKITLDNLTGEARKREAIRQTTQAQIDQFTKFAQALGMSQQEIDQWIAKIKSGAVVQTQAVADSSNNINKMGRLADSAAQQFSSGFASAFVSFLDGTKSAKQAFEEFAASFLKHIAEMLIEQALLSMFGGGGTSGVAGSGSGLLGSIFGTLGAGGVRFAADGIQSVSSPTYFPKFNVVAGEAGTEMLTVLARPTFRSIGGMDAVVGNAGSSRLAITNADDLAQRGGGAGGHMVIEVRGTPDFEGRVVSNSIKGARTQITNDLKRSSAMSAAVKGLTA